MRRVTTLLFVLSAIAIAPYNVAAQSTILFDNPSSGGDAGAINLFLPEGDPNEVFSTGHVTQVIFDTAVRIDSVTSYLTNDTGAFDATEVAVDIFDGDKLEFFGDLPFTGGDFGAAGVTDLSINSSGNLTTLTANNLSITLDAGTYWFGITPLQVTGVSQTESLLNADTSSGVGATFYRQPNVFSGPFSKWTNDYALLGQPDDFTAPLTITGEAIPEPTTASLLALCLVGLVARRRRF